MTQNFFDDLESRMKKMRDEGLYKNEVVISSAQSAHVELLNNKQAINFCANNYLGFANHPSIKEAARKSLDEFGFGMASVRFICGTQTIHLALEAEISDFLQTDDTILYSSCFDANGGLFETLFTAEDAIISDELCHASIIDGIRLCKAQRFRFKNNDMKDLEEKLKESKNCRYRIIVTDGVFSMDGIIADLPNIVELAEKYEALTMIDDCHATGFMGENGRGTHEYWNLLGKIDIITGTLGKALGGASGGYTSGRGEIISYLRQRSRPYLFSNSLSPVITSASLEAFALLKREGGMLRKKLFKNAHQFRKRMSELGFNLAGKDHPIIPVMIGDAKLTQEFAQQMLQEGIYVVGFFYPVVPVGTARIRTQMSAAHSDDDLNRVIESFAKVGRKLKVIK